MRGKAERGKDQQEGTRVPVVWKNAVVNHHGETPKDLQSVGPQSWTKPLTKVV